MKTSTAGLVETATSHSLKLSVVETGLCTDREAGTPPTPTSGAAPRNTGVAGIGDRTWQLRLSGLESLKAQTITAGLQPEATTILSWICSRSMSVE